MKQVYWLIAILFAATCPVLNLYHDGFIDQKWSMTAIAVLAFLLYAFLSHKRMRIGEPVMASAACILTLYLCAYTYLSFLLKSPVLTGPFENPNVLSIHLCLLLPFVYSGLQRAVGTKRIAIVILMLISVLTILLTGCRTGWICLVFFVMAAMLRGRWKYLALPVVVFFGFFLASSFKQSSSQGRSFILHNTLELLAEAPLLGHGTDGFGRLYMAKQAEYFKTHEDKELEMLADDIRHPLNEFLLVGVDHGLLGIALLSVLTLLPLVWRKRLYEQCRPLWQSLSLLLICCLFSYPLLYPLSWLLIVAGWALTFRSKVARICVSHRSLLTVSTSLCLLVAVGYTCLLLSWGYASHQAKRGRSEEMMASYERLYPYLSWRGIFLYDYAIESLYADRYGQAFRLAEECRGKHLSYDLALLEGDICRYMKNYDRALECFDEASLMCPVRFAPPYGKWQVYEEMCEDVKRDSIAGLILQKEIKVYSAEIQMILNNINHNI